MDGANQALLRARVAYRPARSIDPAGKRRFGHGSATPDRGQQVLPAHHTFAVINQKQEKIEYLRFDLPQAPSLTQLSPMPIKGIVFENKQQTDAPPGRATVSLSALRHSRRRKKSRPSQRKINAASKQFGRALASCISRDHARGRASGGGDLCPDKRRFRPNTISRERPAKARRSSSVLQLI